MITNYDQEFYTLASILRKIIKLYVCQRISVYNSKAIFLRAKEKEKEKEERTARAELFERNNLASAPRKLFGCLNETGHNIVSTVNQIDVEGR